MSDRATAIQDILNARPMIEPDGSGSCECNFHGTIDKLLDLQVIVGAPIEISATDSDSSVGSWGHAEVSWPAPEPADPLHVRAREAIERLGIDGSRLELSVSVFGWGSDEANGSLLGLVRKAWVDEMAFSAMDGAAFSQRPDAMVIALEVKADAI